MHTYGLSPYIKRKTEILVIQWIISTNDLLKWIVILYSALCTRLD